MKLQNVIYNTDIPNFSDPHFNNRTIGKRENEGEFSFGWQIVKMLQIGTHDWIRGRWKEDFDDRRVNLS